MQSDVLNEKQQQKQQQQQQISTDTDCSPVISTSATTLIYSGLKLVGCLLY
jgi:hypothetical protein